MGGNILHVESSPHWFYCTLAVCMTIIPPNNCSMSSLVAKASPRTQQNPYSCLFSLLPLFYWNRTIVHGGMIYAFISSLYSLPSLFQLQDYRRKQNVRDLLPYKIFSSQMAILNYFSVIIISKMDITNCLKSNKCCVCYIIKIFLSRRPF